MAYVVMGTYIVMGTYVVMAHSSWRQDLGAALRQVVLENSDDGARAYPFVACMAMPPR